DREPVDAVLDVGSERVPLGAAADGAGDVQAGGELGAAREDEALQLRQRLVERVAEPLELVHQRLRRPEAALDLDGHREVGPDVEQLVLDPLERIAKRRREVRRRERVAELRVELVDGAEGGEACVELRDPRAVAETRLARVSAARVDARETDGLVGAARTHRPEVTLSA